MRPQRVTGHGVGLFLSITVIKHLDKNKKAVKAEGEGRGAFVHPNCSPAQSDGRKHLQCETPLCPQNAS